LRSSWGFVEARLGVRALPGPWSGPFELAVIVPAVVAPGFCGRLSESPRSSMRWALCTRRYPDATVMPTPMCC